MQISVVIPLYNKRETIVEAVESVMRQSFQPQEIIIVDDGSTDGSAQVLSEQKFPLVKLITQTNQGVSVARNTGIAQATSPWIAFLDADDSWDKEFLSVIASLHYTFPEAAVLATAYRFIYMDGTIEAITLHNLTFKGRGIMDNYFQVAATSHPPICSSAVVVSKAACASVGGFPIGIKSGEDLITWAKLSANYTIAYDTHIGANYIHQPSNLGISKIREQANDFVGDQLKKLSLELSDTIQNDQLKQYLGRWMKSKAIIFLEIGENTLARNKALEAMSYSKEKVKLGIVILLSLLPSQLSQWILKKLM